MSRLLIELARPLPPVLAVGAFLKNTLCAISGAQAIITPAIGNLDSAAAIADFEAAAAALQAELPAPPRLVAHDLHPDFYSTRWAQMQTAAALPVQHHHAHIAAIAAEHGHDGPLIGLALDGFGLGPSNQSWGGELLRVDGPAFLRMGHLALLPQPGGDVAAREPWRMAAAALHRMGRGEEIAARFPGQAASARLGLILDKGLHCPPTSSAGRLFDAACGLLGVHPIAEFEGQAPMALEALVTRPEVLPTGWIVQDGVLDLLPLLACLAHCTDPVRGANLFHGTLIEAMIQWITEVAETAGTPYVTLGGGCFLNKVLTAGMVERLSAAGLKPLTASKVSPSDAGLSLGQAWIAALS